MRPDSESIKRAYRLGLRHGKWGVTRLLRNEHIAEEVGGMAYVEDFWRGVLDWRMTRDEDTA